MASRQQFTPIHGEGDIPEIGVGVLGYRFMGRVHTNAYRRIPSTFWPPAARPRLVALCGRNADLVAAAARRYGYEGYYVDWRAMIEDERIQIVDNCGPHSLHVEPSIAALEARKHVICEKPMALNSTDAARMLLTARKSGTKHMCGFNYRFIPAVRLAREIIERGLLGKIYHFRGHYLQESAHNPDRPPAKAPDPDAPWVGSLLNLGSHLIDMARFIVGEPVSVNAQMSTFEPTRPLASGERIKIEADDATYFFQFTEGALRHAECEGEIGEDLFHQAIRLTKGHFEFMTGPAIEGPITITLDTQSLLIEAMRRRDRHQSRPPQPRA